MGYNGLTNLGVEYLARMTAESKPVIFTKIKVGNGSIPSSQTGASTTNLYSFKKEVEILSKSQVENSIKLQVLLNNLDLENGFYVKELGVYVQDGEEEKLYWYINKDNPSFLPDKNTPSTHRYNLFLEVSNLETIIINFTGEGLLADKKFVEDSIEEAFSQFEVGYTETISNLNAEINKKANTNDVNTELNKKLNQGTVPSSLNSAEKIVAALQGNGGLRFDENLLYLNDEGTKKKGFYYLDRLKAGIFECLEQTNEKVNNSAKFKDISNKASSDRLDNHYKNLVTIMKTGFNSEDWIPPLLYFYERFNTQDLGKFIVLLDNKFMGDWINRETPTKRLENMNKILKAIELAKNSNEVVENQELFEFDRERFFSEINGNIYGQRYCKYLLLKIENYKMASDMAFISEYKNISVEHILPQSPKDDSLWRKEFTDDEREHWTNKLANLMLITRRKNSQLSNSEFEEKKKKYLKENLTIFPSNNYIYLNTKKWDVSVLEKRQLEVNKIFGSQDVPELYIKNTVTEKKSQADSKTLISEDIIEGYTQEQDTKKKDTQKDRVINHILNSEMKLCDDCLSEELGITPRQTIYQIASSLKTDERFSREKTTCDRCSGNKLVLMKK